MNLLLDTHVFLWYISGDPRILPHHLAAVQNPANAVYLSVVSLWAVIIKHQLGKLPLPEAPETYLPRQRLLHQINSLPVDEGSVGQLSTLPPLHRDPFDRLLICQALQHNLTLVTADAAIQGYPIPLL